MITLDLVMWAVICAAVIVATQEAISWLAEMAASSTPKEEGDGRSSTRNSG